MAGEGSVYRRASDLRWIAVLPLPDGRKRYFTGKTRREAVEKRNIARGELARGERKATSRQTVAEYLAEWLETKKAGGIDPSTYLNYRGYIRKWITPHLGRVRMGELTPRQVQAFYNRIGKEMSPKTLRSIHAGVMRQAFEFAADVLEIIPRNPVHRKLELPKVEKHEGRRLSQEEARRFVAAIAGDRHECLYILSLVTGLRQGEAMALRWSDIDFKGRRLALARNWERDFKGRRMGTLKSKASQRSILLPEIAIRALRAHRAGQLALAEVQADRWEDRDLVFAQASGRPLNPNIQRTEFYALLERAGLPRITPHELRHSAASILAEMGIPLPVVQAILGHADIGITSKHYIHMGTEAQREAVEMWDRLLGGRPE